VRGHERPGAARRADSLRRHVPRVLRLRAKRAALVGADGHPHHLRVLARLHRSRRGRADAPADRARGDAAPDAQHGRLAAVRHGRNRGGLGGAERGGYVLSDAAGARAVVVATGSEVGIALEAQKQLAAAGLPVRVVSMPSTSVFDRQDADYRNSVLPLGLPKVAVEAGVGDYWRKYVGIEGAVVGIDRYGESAPAGDLFKHFGFTPENIVKAVRSVLGEMKT